MALQPPVFCRGRGRLRTPDRIGPSRRQETCRRPRAASAEAYRGTGGARLSESWNRFAERWKGAARPVDVAEPARIYIIEWKVNGGEMIDYPRREGPAPTRSIVTLFADVW